MSAYLIVEHVITDAAKFEEYRSTVAPMIAKHGGRYLTKGNAHKIVEHWDVLQVVPSEMKHSNGMF